MAIYTVTAPPSTFRVFANGERSFDVRKDTKWAVGDTLVLEEKDPKAGKTGRTLTCLVTYVARGNTKQPGIQPGYVCLALRRVASIPPPPTGHFDEDKFSGDFVVSATPERREGDTDDEDDEEGYAFLSSGAP